MVIFPKITTEVWCLCTNQCWSMQRRGCIMNQGNYKCNLMFSSADYYLIFIALVLTVNKIYSLMMYGGKTWQFVLMKSGRWRRGLQVGFASSLIKPPPAARRPPPATLWRAPIRLLLTGRASRAPCIHFCSLHNLATVMFEAFHSSESWLTLEASCQRGVGFERCGVQYEAASVRRHVLLV